MEDKGLEGATVGRDVRNEGGTKLTKEPERRKDEAKEGMICPWLPG